MSELNIEIDSDIESITSNTLLSENKKIDLITPTSSVIDEKLNKGSILRHVIYQGVTSQIGSAAVRIYFQIS